MNINVPPHARDRFWDQPSDGMCKCHQFSRHFQPPCKPGDPLIFRFDGAMVARAVVHQVLPPKRNRGGRGRVISGWRVSWLPETFEDMRPPQFENAEQQHAASEVAA